MRAGFRSDQAAALYNEALRQGWKQPERRSNSGHAYLLCSHRKCGFKVTFSLTDAYLVNKLQNQITLMRRHGLAWRDRPGMHTAPLFNRKVRNSA